MLGIPINKKIHTIINNMILLLKIGIHEINFFLNRKNLKR